MRGLHTTNNNQLNADVDSPEFGKHSQAVGSDSPSNFILCTLIKKHQWHHSGMEYTLGRVSKSCVAETFTSVKVFPSAVFSRRIISYCFVMQYLLNKTVGSRNIQSRLRACRTYSISNFSCCIRNLLFQVLRSNLHLLLSSVPFRIYYQGLHPLMYLTVRAKLLT